MKDFFELRIETGGPISIIELNEFIEIIDDHIVKELGVDSS